MDVSAQRLAYARQKSGLTLETLYERTGVAVSTLSDIENGKKEPTWGQVSAIAEAFHRSPDFFYESGDPGEPRVLWRSQPAEVVASKAETQFIELCQWYHNLEMLCVEPAKGVLPALAAIEPVAMAAECREALNLGQRPGLSLLAVLEDACHVKVFHLKLEAGNAASTVDDTFGPAILLNADDGTCERTFSLAHELYHLLTWGLDRHSEDDADLFARELLLAGPALERVRSRLSTRQAEPLELAELCRKACVPYWVAFWASHECSVAVARAQDQNIPEWTQDRNISEAPAPTRPERFRELAAQAYKDEKLSVSKMMQLLGISRGEVKRLFDSY